MMSERQQGAVSQGEVTNPFVMVQQKIDAICEKIKVSETCRLRLRECERELKHFKAVVRSIMLELHLSFKI